MLQPLSTGLATLASALLTYSVAALLPAPAAGAAVPAGALAAAALAAPAPLVAPAPVAMPAPGCSTCPASHADSSFSGTPNCDSSATITVMMSQAGTCIPEPSCVQTQSCRFVAKLSFGGDCYSYSFEHDWQDNEVGGFAPPGTTVYLTIRPGCGSEVELLIKAFDPVLGYIDVAATEFVCGPCE